ncbi:hypothetical protein JTE88_00130 [Arcanobacterium phocisimile]|uniref:Cellulase (Glycosyl hydrolase family 5) n=1 Tax=Arcanobacterium phocisimile TaxID=1302235 RepID=A0ABX7IGX4_9ACTO|nr:MULTISPECIES: hypothetical protein [Arcanobacterium]QRV02207.1 hypothetical protein JTE88_00130 [Arcanobacterium phocisimile]
MKFGVNYTPRIGWFHSWLDFTPDHVRADFDAIASLGVDHVRIFPLWPVLQPNRTLIRQRALDDVATVVELAHERGMDTYVDVLQGHLSSFDYLPSWVNSWHRRNIFSDPDVVSGEMALVEALASRLRDVPGAQGLSLGNEFIQFAADRHPEQHKITSAQAHDWLTQLLGVARTVWPDATHVHTHDDDIWFDTAHPFDPASAVKFGDATTVHSWVFGKVGPRFGRGSIQLEWFSRYLCELADAWGQAYGHTQRPVWLQEIGSPSNYVDPGDSAQFLTANIERLMGVHGGGTAPNLNAITWWCSHDVSRSLADFPELEHTLGLCDSDGNVKPIGRAYQEAVTAWQDVEPVSIDRPTLTIDLSSQTRDLADAHHTFFDQWMEQALTGKVPQIAINQIS